MSDFEKTIRSVVTDTSAPDSTLIKNLEELLVEVKKGAIVGVGIAAVTHDECLRTAWFGKDGHLIGASIARLHHRYQSEAYGE